MHEKHRELRTIVIEVLVDKLQLLPVPRFQIEQYISGDLSFPSYRISKFLSMVRLLRTPYSLSRIISLTSSYQHSFSAYLGCFFILSRIDVDFLVVCVLILGPLFFFHVACSNKPTIYTCDHIMLQNGAIPIVE